MPGHCIDTTIQGVERLPTGEAKLYLAPFDRLGRRGQRELFITNPPACDLSGLVGTRVTGDDKFITVARRRWAQRMGWTRIRLIDKRGN